MLWPGEDRRSCCSPGALQRAARTAAYLGLPHHLVDREREFAAEVVEPFVAAYVAGETPNPCVACNPGRLAALVGLADGAGPARASSPATTRASCGATASRSWRAARDARKDQSYMLWAVPPEVLGRLEFPLGDATKQRDPGGRVRGAAALGRRAREPGGVLCRRGLSPLP